MEGKCANGISDRFVVAIGTGLTGVVLGEGCCLVRLVYMCLYSQFCMISIIAVQYYMNGDIWLKSVSVTSNLKMG